MAWYARYILKKRRLKLLILATLSLLVISGGVVAFIFFQNKEQNEVLRQVFTDAESVEFYTQKVDTETSVSERSIVVAGTYHIDKKGSIYGSFSTTTVRVPSISYPIEFTLENISANGKAYVRAKSDNQELNTTIPLGADWRVFRETEIPPAYKEIAITGPILDNLALFSEKGSLVRLEKALPGDTTFTYPLLRFQFSLRPEVAKRQGPLAAIYERVGATGKVDIWVSAEDKKIRHMVFSNPPYFSTTTILNLGTPQAIDIPEE